MTNQSVLLGFILFCSAVQPALGNFSFTTGNSVPLSKTPIDLAGVPLGNGGVGGTGLYTIGDATFNVSGSAADQGFVKGRLVGKHAAPFDPATMSVLTTTYLSTGIGSDTITFSKEQQTFSLLWGSVDTANKLTFLENGNVVYTLTGGAVMTQALTLQPGNQGPEGSLFVTVNDAGGNTFDAVVFSSTSPSFEAALFASSATPEPSFYAVLGAGLMGLAGAVYLRRKTA